jgi:signal transduction histidine kinase/CheY-like chemotaxis protein
MSNFHQDNQDSMNKIEYSNCHLLDAANEIEALLLFSKTVEELTIALNKCAPLISRYQDISSIHILERQKEPSEQLIYRYCWHQEGDINKGNIPADTYLKDIPEPPENLEGLKYTGEYIDFSLFKTKFPDLYKLLEGEVQQSIIAFPVLIVDQLWGYVVFVSATSDIGSNANEITFLNAVSIILVGSYNSVTQREKLTANNKLLTAVKDIAAALFEDIEGGEMESIVYQCLRIIGESTNTDRVRNWKNEMIDGRLHFVLYEEWLSEFGATKPQVPKKYSLPYDDVPGWEDKFNRGESINAPINTLNEIEQNLLAPFGMVSIVLTPLFLNGKLWGFFNIDDCKDERYFSDDEMSLLNGVGFMLSSALEQSRMNQNIRRRDSLYDLVHQVANLLEYREGMNFEKCLYQSLELMSQHLQRERVVVFKYHKDVNKILCVANYQSSDDFKPVYIGYEGSAYVRDTIGTNQIINIRVKDLAAHNQFYFSDLGVKSFLSLPIFMKGEFWGGLSIANCHNDEIFNDDEITILRSASHTIVNALQRNEFLESIRSTSHQLEVALNEAREANNFKTNFLANMSHEMRTPLNAIIALSELAMDAGKLPIKEKGDVEKIYTSGNHLLRLVNDILDISKIEAGKLELYIEQYDLASLLNDIININVVGFEEQSIRFALNVNENLPINLRGDDLRVKQIFSNLLSNAFKYSEGGLVELTVEVRPVDNDPHHTWLIIKVKDDGIGIKEEELDKLFNNYTRLDYSSSKKQEGTGLGLAITKQLIEIMDGNIQVDSIYGKGSTFTAQIKQQLSGNQVFGKQVVENLQNFRYTDVKRRNVDGFIRTPMPSAKILIVDDNQTNLYVFQNILKPYKMLVDCVLSGPEAIKAIKEEKVKYDAIFMDHMMPEMDGMEATRIIREEIGTDYAKNIPIIACTANAIVGSKDMFLDNGFQGFLPKPIDISALNHILKHWVRNRDHKEDDEITSDITTRDLGDSNTRDDSESDDKDTTLNTKPFSEHQEITPTRPTPVDIPGLDETVCLELFNNDVNDYIKFITFFAENTSTKIQSIEAVTADTLHDYAVVVHGIKGSCTWIGAYDVGRKAEELEKAALGGNLNTVLEKNPDFIKDTTTLIENIQTRYK